MKIIKNVSSSQISNTFIGEVNKKRQYIQLFNMEALERLNLLDTIYFNQNIFQNTHEMIFSQYFLEATFYEENNKIAISQDIFEKTLQQKLSNTTTKESQALQIFDHILKSIYSLTLNGFLHRNIRPQHFVLHENKWKLKSAVWSDDIVGYQGQYAWDPKYQSPEEYHNPHPYQDIEGKHVVWYLGSLLIDILFSFHRLGDENKINKFKNKQFSLKAIGANIKISNELSQYLGKMLHYDRNARMGLKQLFSNPFFSKEVSAHFLKNQKKTQNQNTLRVSQLKGNLIQSFLKQSMTNKNLEQHLKIPKQKLQEFQEQIGKADLLRSNARNNLNVSYNIAEIDDIFDKFRQVSAVQKPGISLQKSVKNQPNQLTQKKNNESDDDDSIFGSDLRIETTIQVPHNHVEDTIKKCIKVYQNNIDKAELLWVTCEKITQIPFKQPGKEQIILLNKFSLYYASLIQIELIIYSLNYNKNLYHIDQELFALLLGSKLYQNFKEKEKLNYEAKKSIFEDIAEKILNLPKNQRKLLQNDQILGYVKQRNIKRKKLNDIKPYYRKVLLESYKILSSQYNQNKQGSACKKCMYIVYCLTFDKLYIAQDLRDNFNAFVEYNQKGIQEIKLNDDIFIKVNLREYQQFLQTAPPKKLINYSQYIFRKYFNL